MSRLPWWGVVPVAVALVVLGTILIFRPFTSVDVLVLLAGVVAIVTGVLILVSPDERSQAYRWLVGLAWIVLGIVVLAWPGLSVQALAVIVGVALVVNGVADIVKGLTGRHEEPVAEVIGGLASIVFGVLALSWPDVTVFVVAVLFGARTVLFGLSQLFSVYKRWRQPAAAAATAPEPEQRSWFRRGLRIGTRAVALLVALALLGVSVALRGGETEVTAFYDTPETVPTTPGDLLDTEPLDRSYRTTRKDGGSSTAPRVRSASLRSAAPSCSPPRICPRVRARSSCGRMARSASHGRARRRCTTPQRLASRRFPNCWTTAG
jgi:uncharacterized membrane protein HdeD (DUF308 family)